MDAKFDFDRKIDVSLQRDEAIVLYWYLSRELSPCADARLAATFEHPSEQLSLGALLQELVSPLMDTGHPDEADAIIAAAREHLLARFQ
jgi:hypothetical protein